MASSVGQILLRLTQSHQYIPARLPAATAAAIPTYTQEAIATATSRRRSLQPVNDNSHANSGRSRTPCISAPCVGFKAPPVA